MIQIDFEEALLCESCLYPFCDDGCRSDPSHRAECRFLRLSQEQSKALRRAGEEGLKEPFAYHAVLPLRLALLKTLDPDRYALMDRLMDHREARMKER